LINFLRLKAYYIYYRPRFTTALFVLSALSALKKTISLESLITKHKPKARIRLEIEIEIELDFDQSKQSSLNLSLVFCCDSATDQSLCIIYDASFSDWSVATTL